MLATQGYGKGSSIGTYGYGSFTQVIPQDFIDFIVYIETGLTASVSIDRIVEYDAFIEQGQDIIVDINRTQTETVYIVTEEDEDIEG